MNGISTIAREKKITARIPAPVSFMIDPKGSGGSSTIANATTEALRAKAIEVIMFLKTIRCQKIVAKIPIAETTKERVE